MKLRKIKKQIKANRPLTKKMVKILKSHGEYCMAFHENPRATNCSEHNTCKCYVLDILKKKKFELEYKQKVYNSKEALKPLKDQTYTCQLLLDLYDNFRNVVAFKNWWNRLKKHFVKKQNEDLYSKEFYSDSVMSQGYNQMFEAMKEYLPIYDKLFNANLSVNEKLGSVTSECKDFWRFSFFTEHILYLKKEKKTLIDDYPCPFPY